MSGMSLGFGGAGASGAAATIRALLVIDTSGVGADMKKGQEDAKKGGERAVRQQKSTLETAAKAAYVVQFAFRMAKKVISEVSESVHRLAELRGVGDPVTQSFLRLESGARRLWDSFVLGTLKSQGVQAALGWAADAMKSAATAATGLGGKMDAWFKANAKSVAFFAGELAGAFTYVKDWYSITHDTFKLVANGIAWVAGKVIEFLGKLAGGIGTILDAVGLDKAAKTMKGLGDDWKSFGDALSGEAAKGAEEALQGLSDSFDDIWTSASTAAAAVEKMLREMKVKDTTSTSLREPMQELQFLHDTFASVAGSIGDAWQDGIDRMSASFKVFSEDLKKQQHDDAAAVFMGTSRMLAGFSAAGRQAEQAFGKSSAAARIFVKTQLALQAIQAGVSGFLELGEGTASLDKNPGAAAQHFAASGLFFTAAGLAGAQFAGAIGGKGGGGGSGAGRNALDARASVADTVDRPPVVIMMNVQGNVLGSEEYLKDVFVPRMRRLVEEQGVTFVASDLKNNGRV